MRRLRRIRWRIVDRLDTAATAVLDLLRWVWMATTMFVVRRPRATEWLWWKCPNCHGQVEYRLDRPSMVRAHIDECYFGLSKEDQERDRLASGGW